MKRFSFLTSLIFVFLLAVGSTFAAIPQLIPYQANVLDATKGTPLDGVYSVTFELFDTPNGGTPIWSVNQSVNIEKGYMNLMLGEVNPLNGVDFKKQLYIQVTIGNGTPYPRTKLGATPYAIQAIQAVDADTAKVAQDVVDGVLTWNKFVPAQIIAGGDLQGTYPNPTLRDGVVLENIKPGSITQKYLAPNVTVPPSGKAGGDLSGQYPDPIIAKGAVKTDRIADGAVTLEKLASNAVGTGNIIDGSVMLADLNAEVLNVGGDLDGTLPNPTVVGFQGVPVAATAPWDGALYMYDSEMGHWMPANAAGDIVGPYNNLQIQPGTVGSLEILDGSIMNVDVAADAAIAGTKINPDFGFQDIITTGDLYADNAYITNDVYAKNFFGTLIGGTNGTFDNLVVNLTSHLQGTTTIDGNVHFNGFLDGYNNLVLDNEPITSGDLTGFYPFPLIRDLAVTTNKLADNSVTSVKIADGTIMDADVAANAAIQGSKILPDFGNQTIVTTGIIDAKGTITNSTLNAPVTVDDNLVVTGNLTVNGTINLANVNAVNGTFTNLTVTNPINGTMIGKLTGGNGIAPFTYNGGTDQVVKLTPGTTMGQVQYWDATVPAWGLSGGVAPLATQVLKWNAAGYPTWADDAMTIPFHYIGPTNLAGDPLFWLEKTDDIGDGIRVNLKPDAVNGGNALALTGGGRGKATADIYRYSETDLSQGALRVRTELKKLNANAINTIIDQSSVAGLDPYNTTALKINNNIAGATTDQVHMGIDLTSTVNRGAAIGGSFYSMGATTQGTAGYFGTQSNAAPLTIGVWSDVRGGQKNVGVYGNGGSWGFVTPAGGINNMGVYGYNGGGTAADVAVYALATTSTALRAEAAPAAGTAYNNYAGVVRNTNANGRTMLIEGSTAAVAGIGLTQDQAAGVYTDAANAVLVVRNTAATYATSNDYLAIKAYGSIQSNSAVTGGTLVGINNVVVGDPNGLNQNLLPPATAGAPMVLYGQGAVPNTTGKFAISGVAGDFNWAQPFASPLANIELDVKGDARISGGLWVGGPLSSALTQNHMYIGNNFNVSVDATVVGDVAASWLGSPDRAQMLVNSVQTVAGTSVVTAINNAGTVGTINLNRIAPGAAGQVILNNGAGNVWGTLATNATLLGNGVSTPFAINLANANTWTGMQTFSAAPTGIDVTTNALFDGDVALGNANTDNVVFNADVNSNIIPNTDVTFNLGSPAQRWNNIYFGGTLAGGSATFVNLTVTGNTDLQGPIYNSVGLLNFNDGINQTGAGQVTFSGNVDANLGLDVTGASTFAGTMTQTGGGQVAFSGNVDAQNGLDVTGANFNVDAVFSITQAGVITQTANQQVTFAGNVNANNGLDVTGADLTVATNSYLNGDVYLGDANTDNVYFNADVNTNIIPNTDAAFTLGNDTQRWGTIYVNDRLNMGISGTSKEFGYSAGNQLFWFDDDVVPNFDNTYDLGSTSWRWKDIHYAGTLFGGDAEFNNLRVNINTDLRGPIFNTTQNTAATPLQFGDDMVPTINSTFNLGTPALHWLNMNTDALNTWGPGGITVNNAGGIAIVGSGGLSISSGGANIVGGATITGLLTANNDINVHGNITNTTGDVKVLDNLALTGNYIQSADGGTQLGYSTVASLAALNSSTGTVINYSGPGGLVDATVDFPTGTNGKVIYIINNSGAGIMVWNLTGTTGADVIAPGDMTAFVYVGGWRVLRF